MPEDKRAPLWRLGTYLAALVSLFVLAAAAGVAYVHVRADTDARRAAGADARYAAHAATKPLGEAIQTFRAALNGMAAADIADVVNNPAECTLSFVKIGPFPAGHIDILRSDGAFVCSSRGPGTVPTSYGGADWLAQANAGPVLVAPRTDAATGTKSVVIAAPARGAIIAVFLDLEPLGRELTAGFGGRRQLEFLVTTADGKTVLTRSTSADGRPRIYASATVSSVGWKVYAGADRAAALAAAHRLYREQAGIILGALAVILIAAFVVKRRITGPIEELGAVVRAAAPGAGAPPIAVRGPAEVVALAEDFNSLIGSVERELAQRHQAEEDRGRLQRQLEQSQRLESLGQLAGGVAHDFNNLLAVIINYAAFVDQEVSAANEAAGDGRWDSVCNDIEQIERAAERATRLTHQLLAFARRDVTRPEVLDINDVVRGVQELLRRTISEHVNLTTTLAPRLWPVLADAGQLEQVLVNLAVNGRDAMPAGGTLTIETANVDVDAHYAESRAGLAPGRYVQLRVSDTGEGMDREVIQRAFEPFFTTKPKGEGTGLGLATVYGIVTQAGGYAQIYSEPGLGTTFTALFPATEQDAAPTAAVPSHPRRGKGGETVLVVEDEEAILAVAERILTSHHYRVLTAADGLAAVEIARDHDGPIHLLLTDVVMPHMLGKEVAERITALRPEIGVLYMSGYAQPVLGGTGTLEPGVHLVEKPFSAATLLAKVREALGRDRAAPAP